MKLTPLRILGLAAVAILAPIVAIAAAVVVGFVAGYLSEGSPKPQPVYVEKIVEVSVPSESAPSESAPSESAPSESAPSESR